MLLVVAGYGVMRYHEHFSLCEFDITGMLREHVKSILIGFAYTESVTDHFLTVLVTRILWVRYMVPHSSQRLILATF